VRVTVHESPEAGRYTIRDEGPGFDKRVLGFDPTDAANVDRPSGRGLFLIHTFMDEVDFNERGNEITMTHRYRPPNGTRCDDAPESPMAAAARAPLTAAAAPGQQRE
jgi:anti-sigma regulatory factor (Ser/Thr protein kinase)